QQLCKNWCGPLHFADAPLCDAYDEQSPLCGVAARAYGRLGTPAGSAAAGAAAGQTEPPPGVLPGAAPAPSTPSAEEPAAGCQIGAPGATAPPASSERARVLLAASGLLYAARGRRRSRRWRGW